MLGCRAWNIGGSGWWRTARTARPGGPCSAPRPRSTGLIGPWESAARLGPTAPRRLLSASQTLFLRLVGAGDLSSEAEVTADMTGAIADAFNYMIIELRGLISKVRSATGQVSSMSFSLW